MGILGNPIVTTSFVVDYLNGDAATTVYALSVAPAGVNSISVMISGIQQAPNTYSVLGTQLTFTEAPPTGTDNIVVRHLGIRGTTNSVAASAITATELASDSVTTLKVLNGAITPEKLSTGAPTWNSTNTTVKNSLTTGSGVSTETTAIEVGGARTGDGVSLIDFHATSGSDFEARINRGSGANGNLDITNTGTGNLSLFTNSLERFRIDSVGQIFSNIASTVGPSSATLYKGYLTRMWVTFDGSAGTIKASGNASSITKNAVGSYTVNFTSTLTEGNFSTAANSNNGYVTITALATTSHEVANKDAAGANLDTSHITVSIIR